jgi:hypothetical protein
MVRDNGGTAVDAYDDTILRQMLKPPSKTGTALLGHRLGHVLARYSEGIWMQAGLDRGWVLVVPLLERDHSLCEGDAGYDTSLYWSEVRSAVGQDSARLCLSVGKGFISGETGTSKFDERAYSRRHNNTTQSV